MRHFVEHKQKTYSPVRNFDTHSKFLVGIITLTHPIITLACLKIASILAQTSAETFRHISDAYIDPNSPEKAQFLRLAESKSLFLNYITVLFLIVAVHAGIFQIFRIKNFWANFIISIILLFIGLMIFAPDFLILQQF